MEVEMKQQLYLIEILVDKIGVFTKEEESGARKKLTVKMHFGPKASMTIREGALYEQENENEDEDAVECDEEGHRKWTRTIRIGKSYLFPSNPDAMLGILSQFPLEFEVWDDYEKDDPIFIGLGSMPWDKQFYRWLEATVDATKIQAPVTIKQTVPLFAEACCAQCGDITFILRLSALGESVVSEFDQNISDKERFILRCNKAATVIECKKYKGEDDNFLATGIIYDTITLEDPETLSDTTKYEICTELQPCAGANIQERCNTMHERKPEKIYKIDKIRMGDISGPCGNTNCVLAQKVKDYIRQLEAYKSGKTDSKPLFDKDKKTKPCGQCVCVDDTYHRQSCIDNKEEKDKGAETKKVGGDKAAEEKKDTAHKPAAGKAGEEKKDTAHKPAAGVQKAGEEKKDTAHKPAAGVQKAGEEKKDTAHKPAAGVQKAGEEKKDTAHKPAAGVQKAGEEKKDTAQKTAAEVQKATEEKKDTAHKTAAEAQKAAEEKQIGGNKGESSKK